MPTMSHRRIAQACCDFLDGIKRAEAAQRERAERAVISDIRAANRLPKRHMDWGRWQYSIPLHAYRRLLTVDPELDAADRATREAAWRRFARSSISKHFIADGCAR